MITENLHQPFEVVYTEVDECPLNGHRHSFFELVYVLDGTGYHSIDSNRMNYGKGHMFLITPHTSHHFDISTTTRFFFIRFNHIYLKAQRGLYEHAGLTDWVKKLEYIFCNNTQLPECILKNQGDKLLVKSLVEGIIRENINKATYHQEIVQQLVNSLIAIVARNISMHMPEKVQKNMENAHILQIINYIQSHIYDAEALRVETIAARFRLSANYLSEYFKKHTGESLQQYIVQYKLKLVESRLLHSDMRISEIAEELNFTDESHLNRMFKKYRHTTPNEYRKRKMMMTAQPAEEPKKIPLRRAQRDISKTAQYS
jgi:AraC-like DNA-binding protein